MMDVIATLITGITWGVIINAIWITAYLLLLLYHFSKEDNPEYMAKYEHNRQLIQKMKDDRAAKRLEKKE